MRSPKATPLIIKFQQFLKSNIGGDESE